MTYLSKPYRIISIKEQTRDVKLIRVKSNLNPLPGQFLQVSVPGIGECPLASCSCNSKFVDILLKNAGSVTGKIFNLKKLYNEPKAVLGQIFCEVCK